MDSKTHDLDDFMRAITEEMAREYDRIQKRATEDPGTAGDQGEENWATLLRDWLPPTYQVVTKGRILSEDGIASPQIDVLVLHSTYPKKLLDKKLYLAGGVAAAFECKITLRSEHIAKAFSNAVEIRKHLPKRIGSPYRELHSHVVYGLLAHSHDWKGPKSTPVENVNKWVVEADSNYVNHPREMLDILCIADIATWVSFRSAWLYPVLTDNNDPKAAATTAYICHSNKSENQKGSFTPIGSMITHLLSKLAWEEPSIRRLAQYFLEANISGTGQGKMRLWSEDIYSEKIRQKVLSLHKLNQIRWDEWSIGFF